MQTSRNSPGYFEMVGEIVENGRIRVRFPVLEDLLFDDIPFSAGEEKGVIVPVMGLRDIYITATGSGGAGTFDVYAQTSPDGSFISTDKETVASAVPAVNVVTKKVTSLAPQLFISLKNNGASAARFSLWIYGV